MTSSSKMSWQTSNGSRPPHHRTQTGHHLGSPGLTLRSPPKSRHRQRATLSFRVREEKKVGLDSCPAPGPGVRVRCPHVAAHQSSPLRLDLEMAADPVSILRNHPYLIGKMGCCDSVGRRRPATPWGRSSAGATASSKHSHVTSYLMKSEAAQPCTRRTELTRSLQQGFLCRWVRQVGCEVGTALQTTRWLCSPHPAQTKTSIFRTQRFPSQPACGPPAPQHLSSSPDGLFPPSALGPPRAQAVSPPRAADFPLSSSLTPKASQFCFWWDEA